MHNRKSSKILAGFCALTALQITGCGRETVEFTSRTRTDLAPVENVPQDTTPPDDGATLPPVVVTPSKVVVDNPIPPVATQPETRPPEEKKQEQPPEEKKQEQPPKVEPPVEPKVPPVDPVDPPVTTLTDLFRGQEKVNAKSPDIIFLMDTSASMQQEKEFLQTNINRLVKQLISYNLKDFQLMMVGKDFVFPNEMYEQPNFDAIDAQIFSHDSLDIFIKVANGTFASKLKVRKNRPKELIVVSDDNYGSIIFPKPDDVHIKNFADALNAKGISDVRVNGIVGIPDVSRGEDCIIVRPGTIYAKMAALQNPQGLIMDLCNKNWEALLERLGTFIVEKTLSSTFQLSKAANANEPVVVTINGTVIPTTWYTIDFSKNIITFVSGHFPAKDAEIAVKYSPL